MSFIKNYLWPSKPVPQVDPQEKVNQNIQHLKASLGTLTSRELGFQRDIQINREEAKSRLKLNDKMNAQLYLQRVKLLEKNLSDTISNKFNISQQISTLQNSSFTNQIINNMEETRNTFRAVSQNRNPEYVQSLASDLTEEMDRAALIQSAISGPLVKLGDVSGDLSLLQEEIDNEREIEIDHAFLRMPPIRGEREREKQKQSISERKEAPISQAKGPRIIKMVNGQVRDSLY